MAVDPTDPETFEEDEDVQEGLEYDVEAPEVDAAEQQAEVSPDRDDPLTEVDRTGRARGTWWNRPASSPSTRTTTGEERAGRGAGRDTSRPEGDSSCPL